MSDKCSFRELWGFCVLCGHELGWRDLAKGNKICAACRFSAAEAGKDKRMVLKDDREEAGYTPREAV